jgi:hypothetical protein
MFRRTSVLLTFGFILPCTGCGTLSYYYTCHEGSEIQPRTRAVIEATALRFAKDALAGNVDSSYGQITGEAKKTMSRQQWTRVLDSVKPLVPFDDLSLRRVLNVSGWGFMSTRTSVAVCSGDSSHRDSTVSIALLNVRQQAYAVLETRGTQETWAVVLWLVPRTGGVWQVQAFHFTAVTVLGRSASDLVDEARQESRINHGLNAMLLYTAAAGLASRGPFYHSGVQDEIQQEGARIVPAAEFRSQPPFLLQGPKESFRIVRLAPVAVDKKLYLLISHVVSLSDSGEIVQNNADLMTVFAMRFPEYSHAFAGLVVEATAPGGDRDWRTERANSQISRRASH